MISKSLTPHLKVVAASVSIARGDRLSVSMVPHTTGYGIYAVLTKGETLRMAWALIRAALIGR